MKFAAPSPGDAAAWYKDALGFQASVFGEGDYAIVSRGALTLHLWPCKDRYIAENTSCYVELTTVEDLNALHTEWSQAGIAPGHIDKTPKDQPGHGMREFHVWDPAGNLIGFGAALT